ncbi:30S ribosome-binding factor RbfA [Candidatus Parcubacteria bacterium]|nr:30S ribosome-binding factor RbfA [Candidatus Parcubacteria bacterium]
MPTTRIEKVNSLLQHEIGTILSRDFNFSGSLVTLTRVEANGNLQEAKAYISVMPEDKTDHVIGVLNKGVYDVQQKINKKLNMRPIPKIRFVKDEIIAEAARIEELLEKIKEVEN